MSATRPLDETLNEEDEVRYAETTQPPARAIESLTLENEEDVFKEPEETCEAETHEAMEEEEAWMTAVFVAFRDDSVQVARGRGVTSVVLRVRFHEDSSLFLHAGASRQHGAPTL